MRPKKAFSRRSVLGGLLLGTALTPKLLRAEETSPPEQPFTWEDLKHGMKARAALPDQRPAALDAFLEALSYDDYRNIHFRPEAARWVREDARFRLEPFHPGWLFSEPVAIHEIVDGIAQPLTFSTADFEYRNDVGDKLPKNASLPGVAGVKITTPLNTAGSTTS
ncbi:MAG: glucan biosynthesis protein [Rhodobacteraceae bacterium]|nr:glucan biosynthesis protein [Paracoccaceae bacterium]